jgi:hypothetical protein
LSVSESVQWMAFYVVKAMPTCVYVCVVLYIWCILTLEHHANELFIFINGILHTKCCFSSQTYIKCSTNSTPKFICFWFRWAQTFNFTIITLLHPVFYKLFKKYKSLTLWYHNFFLFSFSNIVIIFYYFVFTEFFSNFMLIDLSKIFWTLIFSEKNLIDSLNINLDKKEYIHKNLIQQLLNFK